MKVALSSFVHSENGLALYVVPETDAERVLLRAMWQHGRLEKCNSPLDDKSGEGFSIHWKLKGGEA